MKQIYNFRLNQSGFTLIELLTSIAILAVVGTIVTSVLTSSLRGSNKTTVVENIRQNGDYALSQISKDITYAQPFDGNNTGFNCDNANNPACLTSCPSSPVTDTTIQSSSGILIKYYCSGATLTANSTPIISSSAASLTSCSFTCAQTATTPIIGISFTLLPQGATGLAENNINSAINFTTSVTMRNYRK
jgi:prepilin-type N-terminal cleavage/methylation domain-containing protein